MLNVDELNKDPELSLSAVHSLAFCCRMPLWNNRVLMTDRPLHSCLPSCGRVYLTRETATGQDCEVLRLSFFRSSRYQDRLSDGVQVDDAGSTVQTGQG